MLIERCPKVLPLTSACQALALNRSSLYVRRKPKQATPQRSRRQAHQPRALTADERTAVVEVLHSNALYKQPPAHV
jgi:putative transposase